MKVAIMLMLIAGGYCWLKDFFNSSNNNYYKIDVIRHLQSCLPDENVKVWEERVRNQNVISETCLIFHKVKNCSFSSYQNGSAEYLNLLIDDASKLCQKRARNKNLLIAMSLFIFILCLLLVLIYFIRIYFI